MKSLVTHILFATDLSKNSTFALRHAVDLMQATGARLHILHAVEPMSDDARITLQMFIQDESARASAMNDRAAYIQAQLKERQKIFWATMTTDQQELQSQIESIEVVEGHPAEVILRRARELDCDLIVLGAHNHGFSQTFLGTVAKRVLRRATIPTLVVPYRPE